MRIRNRGIACVYIDWSTGRIIDEHVGQMWMYTARVHMKKKNMLKPQHICLIRPLLRKLWLCTYWPSLTSSLLLLFCCTCLSGTTLIVDILIKM